MVHMSDVTDNIDDDLVEINPSLPLWHVVKDPYGFRPNPGKMW